MAQNVEYLWTKKRAQFLERAAPTQQLIAAVRAANGPVYVACFPRTKLQAESAVELMVPGKGPGDLIWDAEDARKRAATAFCYSRR